MKEFEEMTLEEKQALLEQLEKISAETDDPIDLLDKSFKELSGMWSEALKEFESNFPEERKSK